MSGKRFIQIGESIRLNHNDAPPYKDRFYWLSKIIDHITACCESKIILSIEIVAGKSQAIVGPHSLSKFEEKFKSKVAALIVQVSESIYGSRRVVMMDNGFGYVPSVVQLKEKGLFSSIVIKKKAHWPKFTKANEVVDHMIGKDVGTIRV